jgi:dGTPase
MQKHGGFNHNTQSYRIVTELENRYPNFMGLNLTYETREGMIKHETEYDKSDAADFEPDKRASLEAQISNLADEIAYNAHDLEDGLRAGLFTPFDLQELVIWQILQDLVHWQDHRFTELERRGIIRELIGMMVTDVVKKTADNLAAHKVESPESLQRLPVNVVEYSADFGKHIRQLKDFLYQRMYRHYRLMRMQTKAENFLSEIFEAYIKEPGMLPEKTHERLPHNPLHRVVTDYIAGMTDRYALDEWEKLFDPYRKA